MKRTQITEVMPSLLYALLFLLNNITFGIGLSSVLLGLLFQKPIQH